MAASALRSALLKRAVPAALSRVPVLRPGFDRREGAAKKPLEGRCQEVIAPANAVRPQLRPVPPLETRYDAEKEILVLCRTSRCCVVERATGAIGLVHSDLNKYWVGECLQEVYADVLKQPRPEASPEQLEFEKDLDGALQTFVKFGSLMVYELGTCCVRDENGVLSVVVDERFRDVYRSRCDSTDSISMEQDVGFALWAVPKIGYQHQIFKVVREEWLTGDMEYVVGNRDKLRVAMPSASDEEVKKGSEVKMSVEIDRSVLGLGRLVIFMPPTSAWNPFEVFAAMDKAGYGMKGLELELREKHPKGVSDKLCPWYMLRLQDYKPFEGQDDDEDVSPSDMPEGMSETGNRDEQVVEETSVAANGGESADASAKGGGKLNAAREEKSESSVPAVEVEAGVELAKNSEMEDSEIPAEEEKQES